MQAPSAARPSARPLPSDGKAGLVAPEARRRLPPDFAAERLLLPLGMSHTRSEPEDYADAQLARPHELVDDSRVQQVPEWRQGAAGATSTEPRAPASDTLDAPSRWPQARPR